MPVFNAPSRGHLSSLGTILLLFACAAPPPAPAAPAAAAPAPTAADATFSAVPSAQSDPAPPAAAAVAPTSSPAQLTSPAETPPPDSRSTALPANTTVLHVGDSFAESLGAPLARRLQAAGVRNVLESKTPSYIPTWAGNGELKRYLQKHKPDLVIITLGGNEFEIPEPADRVDPVKRLVQSLDGRPCVWITPPRWKKDTGVLSVVRDNSAPCRYLDTDTILHDLPKARDKIHPNEAGREAWAEAVLNWLKAERAPTDGRPWALKP